ncbi:GtrA family protein [Arenimonas metalli]|uniref:GtrA family protein n=1 Tax=Arenimonas metalli TaxID=948077 RepID=UPI001FE1460B|nr:GtrA family protein [Arenimonas metalli]
MLRQLVGFGLVGGAQLVLDWACFVLLTMAGMPVVPANLVGRVAGASIGFWLNGRYTFAGPGRPPLGRRQALRFALFWLVMSTASTGAVQLLDAQQGLHAAWLGKPLVDGLLAALGFVASKFWIYR